MNYLLDTNICIYFLKGKFGLVEKIEEIGFDTKLDKGKSLNTI